MSIDLSVDFCGFTLRNPIIPASGTFGFGREYDAFYDIAQLGAIAVKAVTLAPRAGNPVPRVAETPSGMLNAVGLQNPGVAAFTRRDLPWLLEKGVTVIANVSGSTVEEYCAVCDALSATGVHMIELNISCPNVREGGVAFGAHPERVLEVVGAARRHCKQPLIVKLTPNTADITQTALAAVQGGADALSLINTLLGMQIDVRTRRPILANTVGGLSGPAVRPVALRMVYQVCKAVSVPVIGMGGVMTGEDAAAFLLAGARAVGVGTANVCDPMACPRILRELEAYMGEQGFQNMGQLIGALQAP